MSVIACYWADINVRKKVAITKLQAQRAEHLGAFQDLIAQMKAMRSSASEN